MRFKILGVLALLGLVWAGGAWAAGTVTAARSVLPNHAAEIVAFEWTADSSDGSVPAQAALFDVTGWVVLATTDPGEPSPTDNYDIEILDADGADIFGGELLNRDATATEQAAPLVGSTYGPRFVTGPITLKLTNNTALGARGRVKIYVSR